MNTDFATFKEQVRERTDLVALVGVQARSGQRTIKIKCPFHDDSTPSCAIYPDSQTWHCYGGCDTGGDVFAWVMKRDNCDFMVALETLARGAGMELPKFAAEKPEVKERRQAAEEMLDLAARFYHQNLLQHPGAEAHREYLRSRGFGEDAWKQWMLGAAGSANGLVELLKKRGQDLLLAKEVGLIRGDGYDAYGDFFQDRIIIPLVEGRCTYLTARTINGGEPKYLHLKNSQYAKKTLYNRKARAAWAVIVEGPIDVWAIDAMRGELDVAAIALMGLGTSELATSLKRAERVFIGLDSDGTVKSEKVEQAARLVGLSRAYVVRWPGGDDPAAWLKDGGSPEGLEKLLKGARLWTDEYIEALGALSEVEKAREAEHVAQLATGLQAAHADRFLAQVKAVTKGVVKASTLDLMVKDARKAEIAVNGNGKMQPSANGHGAPGGSEDFAYYSVKDGEMFYGGGEMALPITRGGALRYSEAVTTDDGEGRDLNLGLEIALKNGEKRVVRIQAKDSGEEGKVIQAIKSEVGPMLSITANAKKHLIPAIEMVSQAQGLVRRVEITRTGWTESEKGLAYCTPMGVIGELPEGWSAVLPPGYSEGFSNIGIRDDGDEAFHLGISALITHFLSAFDAKITMPLLAFALIGPLARWMPRGKFAMHLSGETGSLKTTAAQTVMALYGDFVDAPPLTSWRSTINAIEMIGFWLCDMPFLVDDYKPSIVKVYQFTDLIQRYAEGNARARLTASIELRRKQAMRGWLFSTGEDMPTGEASVMARMVALRFPRRPADAVWNKSLAIARESADCFPTVTARWIKWLKEKQGAGVREKMHGLHEYLADLAQLSVSGTPNLNRVAGNVARLVATWRTWLEFLQAAGAIDAARAEALSIQFNNVADELVVAQAHMVSEERPTKAFLDMLQAGLDSRRFQMVEKGSEKEPSLGFIGYYDGNGLYLLPAAYNEIARWMRDSGQQIGYTQGELYRLLCEEGLLKSRSKEASTVTVKVGPPLRRRTARVLHLRREALLVGTEEPEVPEAEE